MGTPHQPVWFVILCGSSSCVVRSWVPASCRPRALLATAHAHAHAHMRRPRGPQRPRSMLMHIPHFTCNMHMPAPPPSAAPRGVRGARVTRLAIFGLQPDATRADGLVPLRVHSRVARRPAGRARPPHCPRAGGAWLAADCAGRRPTAGAARTGCARRVGGRRRGRRSRNGASTPCRPPNRSTRAQRVPSPQPLHAYRTRAATVRQGHARLTLGTLGPRVAVELTVGALGVASARRFHRGDTRAGESAGGGSSRTAAEELAHQLVDEHDMGLRYAKGPDGTRGFARGRGRALPGADAAAPPASARRMPSLSVAMATEMDVRSDAI